MLIHESRHLFLFVISDAMISEVTISEYTEEKHVLHTCQINMPLFAKKIINQKFEWHICVIIALNVTNIVLLVIHDKCNISQQTI